jgi:thioredoxin 1
VKVADEPGKPLGRSYQVKLWPTLIVLLDGAEIARFVTPTRQEILTIFRAVDRRSSPDTTTTSPPDPTLPQ